MVVYLFALISSVDNGMPSQPTSPGQIIPTMLKTIQMAVNAPKTMTPTYDGAQQQHALSFVSSLHIFY